MFFRGSRARERSDQCERSLFPEPSSYRAVVCFLDIGYLMLFRLLGACWGGSDPGSRVLFLWLAFALAALGGISLLCSLWRAVISDACRRRCFSGRDSGSLYFGVPPSGGSSAISVALAALRPVGVFCFSRARWWRAVIFDACRRRCFWCRDSGSLGSGLAGLSLSLEVSCSRLAAVVACWPCRAVLTPWASLTSFWLRLQLLRPSRPLSRCLGGGSGLLALPAIHCRA